MDRLNGATDLPAKDVKEPLRTFSNESCSVVIYNDQNEAFAGASDSKDQARQKCTLSVTGTLDHILIIGGLQRTNLKGSTEGEHPRYALIYPYPGLATLENNVMRRTSVMKWTRLLGPYRKARPGIGSLRVKKA